MTRADLIAALEKAEGPSRKLDALIHQSVVPALADAVPNDDGWIVGGNHAQPTKSPLYTASLDAALPWERIVTVVHYRGIYECQQAGEFSYTGTHKHEAMARRIAALKARE